MDNLHLLHVACNDQNYDKVKELLDGNGDADLNGMMDGETLMHIAAGNGDIKIVQLLKDKEADCTKLDNSQHIAMMCACINGHTEVVALLLTLGDKSPVSYRTKNEIGEVVNYSVLMEAINRERKDVAMAIIESIQGEIALQYKTKDHTGKVTTPLRRIIKKMPAVAERAFREITDIPEPNTIPREDVGYEITFHYKYLDDFYEETTTSSNSATTATSTTNAIPTTTNAIPTTDDLWWRPKCHESEHCLQILIDSDSKELLKHPIVAILLYHKWTYIAQYIFLLNFLLHFSFVIFLTSFALSILQPMSATCMAVKTSNATDCRDQFHSSSNPYGVGITGGFVILLSVISLGLEVIQLIKLKERYFLDWTNYLELSLFIGSILFVFVFTNKCLCPASWQWQIGALCIFLAWIDLILLVRMVPVFGIYVVMFIAIVKNFLGVAVLAIFLVMSFGFSFYMLFHDPTNIEEMIMTPFHNPGTSFVKTMTMVTGELDFDTLFRQDRYTGPGLQYPEVTYPLWILFIVLMPILLGNLLTGLAVDDVNNIRENAKLKNLTLWVEFILLFDQFLLPYMRSKNEKKITIKPDGKFPNNYKWFTFLNKPTNWFWFKALQLSYFDTYDYRIIKPDLSEENKRLKEKIQVLDEKVDKGMKISSEENKGLNDKVEEGMKILSEENKRLNDKVEEGMKILSEENKRLKKKIELLDEKADEMMNILRNIAGDSRKNQGISLESP